MKLYSYDRAPNPRRVRMFLAEKNLPALTAQIEVTTVDMAAKENLAPAYLAINPLGNLPALELDDGTVICESVAICRYFEELFPEPALFGATALERAQVEQWNRHAELEVLSASAMSFRHTHAYWAGRIPQAPDWGKIAKDLALERLAWFDSVLAARPWLAGEFLSIADITLLVAIDFGKLTDIRIGPDQLHLARWYAAMKARPSYKA